MGISGESDARSRERIWLAAVAALLTIGSATAYLVIETNDGVDCASPVAFEVDETESNRTVLRSTTEGMSAAAAEQRLRDAGFNITIFLSHVGSHRMHQGEIGRVTQSANFDTVVNAGRSLGGHELTLRNDRDGAVEVEVYCDPVDARGREGTLTTGEERPV